MVGYHAFTRRGGPTSRASFSIQTTYNLTRPLVVATLDLATSDTYDVDTLDIIAERQRRELAEQGLLEPTQRMLPRLKCACCLIRIGPGHHEREVWYDHENRRSICRSCATWPTMAHMQATLLITSNELEQFTLGELNRTIRARSRILDKERK